MSLYRRRPIVIKAIQWKSFDQSAREAGVCDCSQGSVWDEHHIHTLEGLVPTQPGDWIVTGTAGEKFPVKDWIFKKTYERVTGRTLRRM